MYNYRKAEIKDIDNLVHLFDQYRTFYKMESDLLLSKSFLKDRISNQESIIFIAEESDTNMIGFVQLYPLFSSTRMKRLWLLNDLYIKESYRGKGISLVLINLAKKLCVDTNACGLMLETAKSNLIGNNLYPKADFELDNDHNYYSWDNI